MPRLSFGALLLIATLSTLTACARKADNALGLSAATRSVNPSNLTSEHLKDPKSIQIAREYALTLEVEEPALPGAFKRIVDGCNQPAIHCTLLRADLSTGASIDGVIRMRVAPEDRPGIRKTIDGLGKVIRETSTAEDLADAIVDTDGRLKMSRDYRQKLLDLQAKSGNNIDSAIKIAGELARVQQELEQVDGERARHQLRVETEVLEVNLLSPSAGIARHPVQGALQDFRSHLADGVAQAITGVAYIGPWLVLIIPGLLGVRRLWRGRRA